MVKARFCTWTSAENSTQLLLSCCAKNVGTRVPEDLEGQDQNELGNCLLRPSSAAFLTAGPDAAALVLRLPAAKWTV